MAHDVGTQGAAVVREYVGGGLNLTRRRVYFTRTPRCEEMAFECDHVFVPDDREEVRFWGLDGPGEDIAGWVGRRPNRARLVLQPQLAKLQSFSTYFYRRGSDGGRGETYR